MSENVDEDEALFDDIYEDESKTEAPKTETGASNAQPGEPQTKSTANGEFSETTTSQAPPPPPPEAQNSVAQPQTEQLNAGSASDAAAGQLAQVAGQNQPFQQMYQQQQPQMEVPGQGLQQAPVPGQGMQGMQQFQGQQFPGQQFPGQQPAGYDANGKPYFHDKVKADLDGKDVGKLFIGGLTWETDEESLGNYFGQYGEVIELHIMRDTATGRSRGFAFLTFKDAKSVDEVLKKKHILDGKLIDPKRAIPKEEQEKTGKIFVGGIAPDVTHDEFTKYFKQFGDIIDSQLMIDKDTGKSRGYGFVTYDSADAVDRVTRQKYVMFHGRQMEIKKAEPRNQQSRPRQTYGTYGTMGGYAAQPGQPAANPYMQAAGGYYNQNNMAQYWQQMQQMQQYWLQMQQMQQGQAQPQEGEQNDGQPEETENAELPPGSSVDNGSSNSPEPGSDSQGPAANNEEDEVPNPQERAAPKLPSGPKGFHGSRHGRGSARPRGAHRGSSRGRRGGGYHPYRR
ncbi:DEKNAAC100658 [Brettanomyces naardenensis]|uniref:DEKNAAC100658 n=1 Tax=Brettanomyces naardenensis TaxID=13370 RepID=A0A448YFM6_BRENA|nr:DEKNAAC100658 [Brettanomyces naardenensis]